MVFSIFIAKLHSFDIYLFPDRYQTQGVAMAEKKEYRNARRSRMLISQAFLDLLQEKPFEKITATDIIRRADVNRSTFYAHYPDVRGLVEELLNEIINHLTALIDETDFPSLLKNPLPFVEKIAKIGEDYRGLYHLFPQNNFIIQQTNRLQSALLKKAMNAQDIPEKLRGSKSYEIRATFFIGGIFHTYQQWIQGNLDCSSQEIITEISEMIKTSAEAFLSTTPE